MHIIFFLVDDYDVFVFGCQDRIVPYILLVLLWYLYDVRKRSALDYQRLKASKIITRLAARPNIIQLVTKETERKDQEYTSSTLHKMYMLYWKVVN